MKTDRKLGLRREILTDLPAADLAAVAGGVAPTRTCVSCWTVISCFVTDCLFDRTQLCES